MNKWVVGLVVIGVLIIMGGLAWLYQFGGLKYYLRATNYLGQLTGEERTEAEANFYVNRGQFYGGILAGTWKSKVWVWGNSGLKYFNVDEDSIYFYTDGCSKVASGSRSFVKEHILSFDEWRQKVKIGDVVVVLIAGEANGGILGNLREVYVQNWWWFIDEDMEAACAK